MTRFRAVKLWIAAGFALLPGGSGWAANPSDNLRVEVSAAPNFVVDSNIQTPASYGPRCGYISATFYNDGTNSLTNVYAYIGNYTNLTPGIYPSKTDPTTDGTTLTGTFALQHEGGSIGAGDATRYIGTILPGGSKTEYWLVSYPVMDNNGQPVFGSNSSTMDDLSLNYDVWATATRTGTVVTANTTKTATLRSEISAMANKIFPNSANKVPLEYQDLLQKYAPQWDSTEADGSPGTEIRMEGVWYDMGVVNGGYDANNDLVYDNDLWMQPVGDATLFDAGCLRLVQTATLLIVKLKTGGELVYTDVNKLYYTGLPENNGVVGYVRYEFLPLSAPCSLQLTPYQEAASGANNEKFNGDFGSGSVPPTATTTSAVTMAKSGSLAVADPGQTNLYSIAYTNAGTNVLGNPAVGMPLVISDCIPTGMTYVAGSAAGSNVLPAGVTSYTILYSTNRGVSWTNSEPAAATNVTCIQWWLSDALAAGATGTVRFSARVVSPYLAPSPMIINTGKLSFGSSASFLESTANTLVTGANRLGDTVFLDNGTGGGSYGDGIQSGSETGLSGVVVYLYFDANTNGVRDSSDILLQTTNTTSSGAYIFTNLPDGKYVAVVNTSSNIPAGYTVTTPSYYAADLDSARATNATVSFLTADFGFAPALVTTKTLTSSTNMVEGRTVTYSLTVSNALPGDGTGGAQYMGWAGSSSGTDWLSTSNMLGAPDGMYSSNIYSAPAKALVVDNFSVGEHAGNISNVYLVMPVLMVASFDANDTFDLTVKQKSPALTIFTKSYLASSLTNQTYVIPVTGTYAWAWNAFGTNISVDLVADKHGGANPSGYMKLDALGFRVVSDQPDTNTFATTTLDPVPLTDQYNSSFLQYLSASVTPTTVNTNSGGTFPNQQGTLFWDNLGPLYPGGSRQITVSFKALEPFNGTSNTASVVTNIEFVTNATFASGTSAGSFTNTVTNTLNPAGSIGDFIWRDIDKDGVQDGGSEAGIANVQVRLTPPAGVDVGSGPGVPVTNTTDSSGFYLFEGIAVWTNYTITVLTNTLPGAFTNTFDADGNSNNVVITNFNPLVTNGLDNLRTIDFGYFLGSTIDGTIWWDFNSSSNSTRDAGELWLTNVIVRLYTNGNPVALATNTTSTNGYFSFTGNYTGSYYIVVSTNTGMMTNSLWRQTFDSDGLASANTVTVSVVLGGTAHGDFSYVRTNNLTLGDTVFYDWDGNGTQNTNSEEGIPAVPVLLYYDVNSNGAVDVGVDAYIGSQTTASNGFYQFSGLQTGNYIVVVDQSHSNFPNSVTCTADPVNPKNGISYLYLTVSTNNQDFGFRPYGSGAIGDTVWRDLNGDGVQLGGAETGIANVPVYLEVDADTNGVYVRIATNNTDSLGRYLFSSLADARYRVVVDTTSTNIPRDSLGIVYTPTTSTTTNVTISGGNTYLNADFGFAPFGAIGDFIFWDANTNGLQDTFEVGVTGAVVTLYRDVNTNGIYDSGTDTPVATNVTSTNGTYLFSGLSTGLYVVVVSTNGVLTNKDLTADPEADGVPASTATNATAQDAQTGVRINYGTFFMGADFGFQPPGVIGDLVWLDSNTNGVFDVGEVGLPYVSVVVSNVSTAVKMTNVTDSSGYYGFGNLADGTYQVTVSTSTLPAGLTAVYDPDGTNDGVAVSVVISNGNVVSVGGTARTNFDLSIDFGYRYAGNNSLSGTVGLDAEPYDGRMGGTNTSGVSAGEYAYSNVTVYAYMWKDSNSNGVVDSGETVSLASTTTSTNGDYSFTGLPSTLGSGTNYYIVSLASPQENLSITTTNGATPALWINVTTNLSGETLSAYQVVAIGAAVTNIDFAFKSTLLQDYGDLPSVYGTLLTDSPSGARHVVATTPTLYLGTNVSTDSNGAPTVDASGDTFDDGVVATNVWLTGTNGTTLTVQVGKGSGWLVAYVDFGQKGNFLGTNDMIINQAVATNGGNGSGLYTFTVNVPTNGVSVTAETVLYARFRLFPGEPTIPELAYAGLANNGEVEDYRWRLGAVGNTVWFDANTNGVKDGAEYGLTNVVVFADLNTNGVRDAGEPSGSTDTNGTYGIGGLPAGTYTIRVDTNTLPAGLYPFYDLDWGQDNQAPVTLAAGDVNDALDFGYFSSLVTPPSLAPDFLITKTLISPTNRPAVVGEQQVFTISVTNTGNVFLDTVPVTDVFNTNYVSFVSAAPAPTATNPTSLVWTNLGSLAVGEQVVVTTRFSVVAAGVGTNSASSAPTTNGVPLPAETNSVVYTNVAAASIAGSVWRDINGNGVKDAADTNGISGVQIVLATTNGVPLATNVTSGTGGYLFTTLAAGTYWVIETDPSGYVSTTTNTLTVPLATGENSTGNDFLDTLAVAPAITIVKTAGSAPEGGTHYIVTGASVTYTYAVSNSGGCWLGPVTVTDDKLGLIGTIPLLAEGATTNLTFTTNIFADVTNVAVAAGTPVDTNSVPLGYPGVNATNDAVVDEAPPATIGDYTWEDVNADGLQDGGEPALSNVVVTLYDTNSVVLATVTSTVSGAYAFTNLPAGTYVVGFTRPTSFYVITDNVGTNADLDSDPNPLTGLTAPIALAGGQTNLSVDAGFYLGGSISGSVLVDVDGDGVVDPEDTAGIPGVTVLLLDASSNVVETTVTSTNGYYAFPTVDTGSYVVVQLLPGGYSNTFDVVPPNDLRIPRTISSGQASITNDFYDTRAGSPAGNKVLYLSDPGQALDRIDPVASGDATSTNSAILGTLARDNTSSTNGNAASFTFSHVTGPGSDRLLLVGISMYYPNANVTNVTYGGNTLTSVGTATSGGGAMAVKMQIFRLVNPPSGTNTVVVQMDAAVETVIGASTFTGVDTNTPLGTFVSAVGNSAAPLVTNSSAAAELVFDTMAVGSAAAASPAAGQTQLWRTNTTALTGGGSVRAGAASVTNSWTTGSARWSIGSVPIKPSPSLTNQTVFTQSPAFVLPFALASNATIKITNYVSVVGGVMPASPAITATLSAGGTTFLTVTNPAYDSGAGTLAWTGALTGNVSVAAGQAISLTVSNAQTNVQFRINYDSTSYPSRIILPTASIIAVPSVGIYNAAYPGGVPVDASPVTSMRYVRVMVTDPFGAYDITSAGLVIDGPGTVGDVSVTLTNAHIVATNTWSKTYEYAWQTVTNSGSYTLTVTANEGTEGITATGTATEVLYSPAIRVVKTADSAADGAVDYILAGQSVTYYYAVTNTGDVALNNVTVIDDRLGTIATGLTLPAGGTTNLTASTNITVDTTNVVTVTGTANVPGVGSVTNSDDAVVDVVAPAVAITKTLVSPAGRPAMVGETVVFAIAVANTGDTVLSTVPVTETFNTNYVSYLSTTPAANTTNPTSVVWTNLGPLGLGGSSIVTARFTAVSAGLWTNTAVTAPTATNGVPVPPGTSSVPHQVISGVASIGDRVWLDENADGVQDAGEAGIANVTVTLRDTNGVAISTNVTDLEGRYLFAGLGAGTYTVRVETNSMPAGLATNQTFDPDTTTNHQTTVTLTVEQNVTTADFGYSWNPTSDVTGNTGTGAIGDRVWIDADGDGAQDPGEPGLSGVVVRLYRDIAGNGSYTSLVATVTNDAAGSYIFDGLAAGAYVVVVNGGSNITGYTQTGDPDSTLDHKTTTPIVLAPGDVYVNADFGYQPAASSAIGDLVYFDSNADGTNNAGDYGLGGVTVSLLNSNGVVIATTMTATNGTYLFTGVPTGTYTVVVSDTLGALARLSASADPDGPASLDGRSTLTVDGASNYLDRDFGYTALGQLATAGLIGDTVFLDRNTNGVFEAGEGLQGVTVRLTDANGVEVGTTVTDGNGRYYFGGLAAGSYVVEVSTNTLPGPLGQLTNSVDPDGGTANRSTLTLTNGQINLAQDFGYRPATPNTISGTLWNDSNADGAQDGGETNRFSGVTVALTDTNGMVIATALTDTNGSYSFTGLPDGTYRVDVTDDGNLLNGYWHSDGTNDNAEANSQNDPYSVAVSGGATNVTGDFGYYIQGASLGNLIWLDSNGNGVQEGGEPGLTNSVTINLTIVYPNGTTNVVRTVSATNGYYSFGNLLLDENFRTAGSTGDVSRPQFTLSITQIPSGKFATPAYAAGNIWLDSGRLAGTAAFPVKGENNMQLNASPTNEPVQASYDFGFSPSLTLVRLISFGGFSRDGAAIIAWETAEEIGTAGFFLERGNAAGAFERINEELIPAELFGGDFARYEQVDPGARPGGTYLYRLIEQEINGALRYMGPYLVTIDGAVLSLDEWSRTVFDAAGQGNPAVSGMDVDPDGDGMDNLAELLAGTDPTNSVSALRIEAVDQAGSGGVRLQWSSQNGRLYSIDVSTNFPGGSFEPLVQGLPATPPDNVWTDYPPASLRQSVYRIRIE